jgi:hypothetical protein
MTCRGKFKRNCDRPILGRFATIVFINRNERYPLAVIRNKILPEQYRFHDLKGYVVLFVAFATSPSGCHVPFATVERHARNNT